MEALIALVLFAMGVLAAAGVAAASLRSASTGARTRRGAWLAVASAGEMARRAEQDDGCVGFSAGTRAGAGGTILSWSFRPEQRGLAVLLITTYPVSGRSRSDTMWSFIPCR